MSSEPVRIALDAMGGDFAPENPVAGAIQALKIYPELFVYLVGDELKILNELRKHEVRDLTHRFEVKHTTQVIEMGDGAVEGIRRKKDSSILRAVELVRDGLAQAVVSAGHTGAALASAQIRLRTLPGIARSAIATVMPTETNLFVLIDSGANPEVDPENLVEFAIMGTIFSREVLQYKNPRVGLMSNGTEDGKGNSLVKESFKLLSQAPINFHGNVEGHDLFCNPVEVVVCDGFTGNVVLKTAESIADAIFSWLKRELKKSPFRMFGAWLAKGAFRAIRRKTNYEEYGGSLLLGVNGVCVIAHGASTPKAIKNAIRVARESIAHQVNPMIVEQIKAYHDSQSIST